MIQKIDIIPQYSLIPVQQEDGTMTSYSFDDKDVTSVIALMNELNNNEFDIQVINIKNDSGFIFIFSELYFSENQVINNWEISSLTAPQQTIINDFIDSL